MDAANMRPENRIVVDGDGTIESGRLALEELFMQDRLPTAFMCVNDQTAIGVMLGLTARGYNIPRDFSVTGFDDVPLSGFMSPPLTTIRQPRTAIGKRAMALLLDLLGAGEAPEGEILLMPDLVCAIPWGRRRGCGKPQSKKPPHPAPLTLGHPLPQGRGGTARPRLVLFSPWEDEDAGRQMRVPLRRGKTAGRMTPRRNQPQTYRLTMFSSSSCLPDFGCGLMS